MSAPREIRRLDTRHLGRSVLIFGEVPSTNDLAATFAHDLRHAGTVFVADFQTGGRGQYGRVWRADPGTSLLMSVLLFPPPELRRPVVLTAWAAVGIADAIADLTGAQARIKWPNDLLIGGKKVCGILIEQAFAVVVGLGLNLNQTAGDFDDLPDATSLGIAADRRIDPDAALETVLRHLDIGYDRLLSEELPALESEWRRRVGLVGRPVRIEGTDGTSQVGILRTMGFDGLALEGGDSIRPESIRALSGIAAIALH